MEQKRRMIAALALALRNRKATMQGSELGEILNTVGVETSYGLPYEGGRGVFTLIREVQHHYQETNPAIAEAVAFAFTDKNDELPLGLKR